MTNRIYRHTSICNPFVVVLVSFLSSTYLSKKKKRVSFLKKNVKTTTNFTIEVIETYMTMNVIGVTSKHNKYIN